MTDREPVRCLICAAPLPERVWWRTLLVILSPALCADAYACNERALRRIGRGRE